MSTLIIGTIIITFIIYFLLPKKGLLALLKRSKINSQKEFLEDALKHLYDCEYNSNDCSLSTIAGSLSISKEETVEVINRLQKMELIELSEGKLNLTDEGRSYALRIIRVHRLWERYLSEETSVNEEDWHIEAEAMEHLLSGEEVEKLAADIGNPLVDPHGDPIPTVSGEMPVKKGLQLTELQIGSFAKILHIEDEPPALYAQIIAEGLYPGQQIRLLENSHQRVRFEANGDILVLAPVIASNITVEPINESEAATKSYHRLSDLKVGENGTVIGISKAIRGTQRRRLLDLGLVPGTNVQAEIQSLGGDPTGYRIRGATIAIRKNHAEQVFIKEIERR